MKPNCLSTDDISLTSSHGNDISEHYISLLASGPPYHAALRLIAERWATEMRCDKRKEIKTRYLATGCALYLNDLTHPELGCPTSHTASTMSTSHIPVQWETTQMLLWRTTRCRSFWKAKIKTDAPSCLSELAPPFQLQNTWGTSLSFLTSARPGRDSLKGRVGGEEATTLLVTSLHPCPVLYRKH